MHKCPPHQASSEHDDSKPCNIVFGLLQGLLERLAKHQFLPSEHADVAYRLSMFAG